MFFKKKRGEGLATDSKQYFRQRRKTPSDKFWDAFEDNLKNGHSKDIPKLMKTIQNRVGADASLVMIDVESASETPLVMIEILSFLAGTYYAALLENKIVSSDDEIFLEQEFYTLLTDTINKYVPDKSTKDILKRRAFEYGHACKENVLCGKSMKGYQDLSFDEIDEWCEEPRVKCALLFCDYISYHQMTGRFAQMDDLVQLKTLAIRNSLLRVGYMGKIYSIAHSIAQDIYSRVSKMVRNEMRPSSGSGTLSDEEQYGKAWLMIVGQSQKAEGLRMMSELDQKGFIEATLVCAMFAEDSSERMRLVKKAADSGNSEGIWEYCGFLKHSYCPDPSNADDAKWERYCLAAAEGGSVDAMNEMGNISHRRGNYVESMYWYAMANAHGQPDGTVSMKFIAQKWLKAGAPSVFVLGSRKLDFLRFRCALAYLEIYAGMELSVSPDEATEYILKGVPLAAYLSGDIFESIENYAMAYKMYNAIATKKDPHGLKCCADMLLVGRGTDRDMNTAIKYYQMAAELGEREAMFITGEFAKDKSKYLAAYWFGLSHTRGYEHGLERLIQLAHS